MTLKSQILALAHLPSGQIADEVDCSARYARRILAAAGLNHPVGAPAGSRNPAWKGGRTVDADGYVIVRQNRRGVQEHRLLASHMLGRPLRREEVVDHIDGLTLHNVESNLRVFVNNGLHLAETLRGRPKVFSKAGFENIGVRTDLGESVSVVDIHRLRRARGDVRLHAILRCVSELGIKHPCLSLLPYWLADTGIHPLTQRNLARELTALCQRFELDLR